MLTTKIDRAKRSITRMKLERALLLEKLEEKTPAHVDYSDGSESEASSVPPLTPRLGLIRRLKTKNHYALNYLEEDGVAQQEHLTQPSQNNPHLPRITTTAALKRLTPVSTSSCNTPPQPAKAAEKEHPPAVEEAPVPLPPRNRHEIPMRRNGPRIRF